MLVFKKVKNTTLLYILLAAIIFIGLVIMFNPVDIYKTAKIRYQESDLYGQYKQIDMKNLTGEEKRHLSEMHQRYGDGPIESTKLNDRMPDKWIKMKQHSFTYSGVITKK